jgi:hypothetical protein
VCRTGRLKEDVWIPAGQVRKSALLPQEASRAPATLFRPESEFGHLLLPPKTDLYSGLGNYVVETPSDRLRTLSAFFANGRDEKGLS